MKRKIQVMLLAGCMLLLAVGCGSKSLSDSVNDAATVESGSAAANNETGTDTAALNVENDSFTFEQLTLQVGEKEADVLTFLGATEKKDSYSTILFGEDVSIVLTSDGDTVSAAELTFEGTDSEAVANAIGEQLGQDGESTDNIVKWTYQNNTVTLTMSDNGCVVEITKA